MKKLIFIFIAVCSFLISAEEKISFEKDIVSWHKKAVMTCGALKKSPVNEQMVLKNIKELQSEIAKISKKYLTNVPKAYKNDANWPGYLTALTEYVTVIGERIEKKQYPKASVFCPNICMTFGKMHKINGKTDITDVMFAWRMEMKKTTEMVSAKNFKDAKNNIAAVENHFRKLKEMIKKNKNPEFEKLFNPLEKIYSEWINVNKTKKWDKVPFVFGRFLKTFPRSYLYTLN